MPSLTGGGYPYPLPGEPVREGAQRIQELATAVDQRFGTLMEVAKGSSQNVGSGAWTNIAVPDLQRERDPLGMITQDATSPILQVAGWWDVLIMARWASTPASAAGRRAIGWIVSTGAGTPALSNQTIQGAGATGALVQSFRDLVYLGTAANRVLLTAFQDSGVTLTIDWARIVVRYAGAAVAP